MVSGIFLTRLAEKAKTSKSACFQLGELLYAAEKSGKMIEIDKENKLYRIKER